MSEEEKEYPSEDIENNSKEPQQGKRTFTRRSFLRKFGLGGAATAASALGARKALGSDDTNQSDDNQTNEEISQETKEHKAVIPGLASNAEGNTQTKPEPNGDNRLEVIEGFPYSRSEVMFGENAGFEKARKGETLTISFKEYSSHMTKEEIEEVLDRWNKFTFGLGRKTALFKVADENEDSDIKITPGDVTYVVNYSNGKIDYENNYDTSIINMEAYTSKERRQHVLTHELVHSLGIVDAIPDNLSEEQMESYVNPIILPESKEKNLQSIIDWHDWAESEEKWFGEHDANLLKLAGYVPTNQ